MPRNHRIRVTPTVKKARPACASTLANAIAAWPRSQIRMDLAAASSSRHKETALGPARTAVGTDVGDGAIGISFKRVTCIDQRGLRGEHKVPVGRKV